MGEFRKARRRVDISVGESVRIIRELQKLSQNQLAALSGIPQSTISAIERDRVNLGVERAKVLARALKVHPAVLVFPSWDVERESAARRPRSRQQRDAPIHEVGPQSIQGRTSRITDQRDRVSVNVPAGVKHE